MSSLAVSGSGNTFSLSDIEVGERRAEISLAGCLALCFVSVKSGADLAEEAAFAAERVKSAGIVGFPIAD